MLKILHVISGLKQAAGPTAFCVAVCDRLADSDVHISILHEGPTGGACCLPKNPRVRLIDGFKNISQKEDLPDLVHIHALWSPLSHRGICYARKHRIPYVVSAHGMLAPWALRHKWLKKKLAWWLYQKADLEGAAMFHATAESEVRWLRDLGFRQPCVLAPLGSDLPDESVLQVKKHTVRRFLFVGRVHPVKGLVNLVRAFAKFKSNASGSAGKWQVVLAGPDQAGHMKELIELCRQLNLTVENVSGLEEGRKVAAVQQSQADILFTGGVYGCGKDSLHLLADVFVLPSFTENFGVVVTDALAYGIPVITTKGTPWSELLGHTDHSFVHDGESASVSKPGDGGPGTEERVDATVGDRQSAIGESSSSPDLLSNERMDVRTNERAAASRCGWWVEIGVEPLASALREAASLADADRYQMGMNGRRLVEAKYTWPAVAAEVKKAYEWKLKGRGAPSCIWK